MRPQFTQFVLATLGLAIPLAATGRAQLAEAWLRTDSSFSTHGFAVAPDGRNVVPGSSISASKAYAHLRDADGATLWSVAFDLGPTTTESFFANAFTSQVRRFEHVSRAVCFGDGSGTGCPCGNASAAIDRVGCLHSLGLGGRLDSAGTPDLSSDTLRLDATNVPNASVLVFQGTSAIGGGAGSVFGDGLRCAGGHVIRLATSTAVLGATSYPAVGGATVSARGLVGSSGTRWYQAWFRNSASFCTPSTFNLTNALAIDWSA